MQNVGHHKPIVSVLIAVYNTEDYLVECLNSILNQTYRNIEIIIINDGSTDKSGELCQEYENRYSNITYVNKDNGGAAQARNIGIRLSKGEYITMVDSDDTINKKHIELLLNNAINNQADISVCNYYVYNDGRTTLRNHKPKYIKFTNVDAIKDHLLEGSILEPMICNKLFKRNLFTEYGLWFPEGQMYEDSRNLYKLYYYANNIVFENNPTYYYRRRQGSVMNHGVRKANIDMLQNIATEASDWLSDKNIDLTKELEVYELTSYINCLNYMIDGNKIYKDEWNKIIAKIIVHKNTYLVNPYVSKKRKLTIKYLELGPHYYTIIRRLYKYREALVK